VGLDRRLDDVLVRGDVIVGDLRHVAPRPPLEPLSHPQDRDVVQHPPAQLRLEEQADCLPCEVRLDGAADRPLASNLAEPAEDLLDRHLPNQRLPRNLRLTGNLRERLR
jgi:hypothetical protein